MKTNPNQIWSSIKKSQSIRGSSFVVRLRGRDATPNIRRQTSPAPDPALLGLLCFRARRSTSGSATRVRTSQTRNATRPPVRISMQSPDFDLDGRPSVSCRSMWEEGKICSMKVREKEASAAPLTEIHPEKLEGTQTMMSVNGPPSSERRKCRLRACRHCKASWVRRVFGL